MTNGNGRKFGLVEIITIATVLLSAAGGLVLYAIGINDRLTLIQERVTLLRKDVDQIENGSPMVNARLERQRLDLDALEKRVDILADHHQQED